MPSRFGLRGLLRPFSSMRPPSLPSNGLLTTLCSALVAPSPRAGFSTTPIASARDPKKQPQGKFKAGAAGSRNPFDIANLKKGKKRKGQIVKKDPKVEALMAVLETTREVPPPLRMARNRHLRHWTIHRAWMLFRRKRREQRERELMQQYQAMYNACEDLRTSDGPGRQPEGYLYRIAMQKFDVFSERAVPIEYARAQVETPGKEPWNHGWKR